MRKIGAEGGVVAIKNIDPYDFLGSKPPLGTVDRDGLPTSEISSAVCVNDASLRQTQAFMGMFEQFYGKVSFSYSSDQDAQDAIDLTTGRDRAKGYQNVTGSVEFQMRYFDNKWEGAVKGKWFPLKRLYDWNPYFRRYEIMLVLNPNEQCLKFTEAERLVKLIGVRLENSEVELSQPNTIAVPFFAKRIQEYPNWKQSDWPGEELLNMNPNASGQYSLTKAITKPLNTRLKLTFANITAYGKVKLIGYNILDEQVIEEVDLNGLDPEVYITKNYFSMVCPGGVHLAGFTGASANLKINEFDHVPFPEVDYTKL